MKNQDPNAHTATFSASIRPPLTPNSHSRIQARRSAANVHSSRPMRILITRTSVYMDKARHEISRGWVFRPPVRPHLQRQGNTLSDLPAKCAKPSRGRLLPETNGGLPG